MKDVINISSDDDAVGQSGAHRNGHFKASFEVAKSGNHGQYQREAIGRKIWISLTLSKNKMSSVPLII